MRASSLRACSMFSCSDSMLAPPACRYRPCKSCSCLRARWTCACAASSASPRAAIWACNCATRWPHHCAPCAANQCGSCCCSACRLAWCWACCCSRVARSRSGSSDTYCALASSRSAWMEASSAKPSTTFCASSKAAWSSSTSSRKISSMLLSCLRPAARLSSVKALGPTSKKLCSLARYGALLLNICKPSLSLASRVSALAPPLCCSSSHRSRLCSCPCAKSQRFCMSAADWLLPSNHSSAPSQTDSAPRTSRAATPVAQRPARAMWSPLSLPWPLAPRT